MINFQGFQKISFMVFSEALSVHSLLAFYGMIYRKQWQFGITH